MNNKISVSLNQILTITIMPLFGLLVYWKVFSAFFFMDDFYFLSISQANNLKDFFTFFIPIKSIPYRPISQQLFFYCFYKLFGLNPLPFHLFIFGTHLINGFLIFNISNKLIHNRFKSYLAGLIYIVSPIHFVGLYSITGSYFLFGVFYFLLSIYLWLEYQFKNKKFLYCLSLFFNMIGVFAAEIVAILPLILVLLPIKKKTKNVGLKILPRVAFSIIIILINLFWAGAPTTSAFQLTLNKLFTTMRWYFLRAFGLPEGIKNGSQLERTILYCLFPLICSLLLWTLYKNKKLIIKNYQQIIKYILWIIAGSSLFFLMPNHLNPIYFSISFLGILLIIQMIMSETILLFYSILFVFISYFSVNLLTHTHWTVVRSRTAAYWLDQVKTGKIVRRADVVTFFLPSESDKDDLIINLQGNKAVDLLLRDTSIKVKYEVK